MGNLNMAALIDFRILWFTFYIIILGIVILYYLSPRFNIISFGTDDALTAGVNIKRTQTIAFAVAALITAISVSFSGLIGFVGLIVPHGVRLAFGPDHRQLIPLSAITGAIFLVISDAVARVILAPSEMPVGVVTAIAGGPFFIFLLLKYTKKMGWAVK